MTYYRYQSMLSEDNSMQTIILSPSAVIRPSNWQGRPGLVETIVFILSNTRNMLHLQQHASRISKQMYLGHIIHP